VKNERNGRRKEEKGKEEDDDNEEPNRDPLVIIKFFLS